MSDLGEKLMQALQEALEHTRGERALKTHRPERQPKPQKPTKE